MTEPKSHAIPEEIQERAERIADALFKMPYKPLKESRLGKSEPKKPS